MQEIEDSELVKKYLAGDSSALEQLIQRYFRQVFLFAKTYVKNDVEAEDITQEAFVKAWKNIKKFDTEKKFKTWLFQITKNTCIDHLRKHKGQVAPENLDEEQMAGALEKIVDSAPLPEALFDAAGFEEKLDEIISSMPHNQSLTVSLHLQQDLTFEEISQILQEPLNTVKSRYRRALLTIRDKLAKTKR